MTERSNVGWHGYRPQRLVFIIASVCALTPGRALAQDVLTLRQTVELALRNDIRMFEAASKQESAGRELDVSRARFAPNLFTGTGAMYTYGFPQTPGGTLPSVLQQSIQRLRGARESARAIVDLEIERLNEGRLLPLDILQARLAAARLTESVVALENRESALADQLRVLTGIASGRPIHIAIEDLPSLPERSPAELSALAAGTSPELKATQLESRAREETLAGERGGYWPSVDLVGNYAVFSRFNNVDVFFNRFQRNNLNLGIEARVPIFSTQTGAAVALARSQVIEAQAAVNRQREEIGVQVRRAAERVRETSARRDVAEVELAVAQETVRLAEARMAEGRAARIDREKALVEEGRAWDLFFQAEWARKRAQLELRRMTGELAQLFP